ncbi:MAG: 3-hexulose-6-phosphate synthase [Atopobiaceae bacterium]|nr:3-hexulose-6-phosphate synthase [Atopobiaceae bacterium]
MQLQIALDTLDLDACMTLLDEVHEHIGIIEVGTPFIILEGMRLVRVLSERYPDCAVLADCKIMDAGELEADHAFEAGADIVTVLGVAANATIEGVVRSARRHGKQVMVDMIDCPNLAERAAQIEKLGVDYICVHTAFDVQAHSAGPLDELRVLNTVLTRARAAVAGGVSLSTIDDIVAEGAEVIVVGGAIANAQNRAEAARALAERLHTHE